MPVPLPPLSFSLLLTLARNAPNVVTTAQLEKDVWKGLVVDRGTINKRVVLVRQALRQAGCKQDYIAVIRGTGYRLAVPVNEMDESVPPGPKVSEGRSHSLSDAIIGGRKFRWLVAVLVILMLAIVIGTEHADGPERTTETSDRAGTPEAEPWPLPSVGTIAVLPFRDSSAGGDDGFFAEGVSRELARLLSSVDGLSVASTASSFRFQKNNEPLIETAERLGVQVLISGEVAKGTEEIEIAVQLLEVASGQTLFDKTMRRPLADVFILQGDIADELAMALGATRSDRSRLHESPVVTSDIEAFGLYLKGWSLLDGRLEVGASAINAALENFETAVRIDPVFTRAHVGIAAANFLLPAYDKSLDQVELLARAEASARYALELNPESAEAHGVLAAIRNWQGAPMQAAGMFEHARELGLSDPNILHWHAMLFTNMGYFESLVPMLEDAYRLDPLNELLGCSLASSLNLSGRPEDSLLVLDGMSHFSRRDLTTALASLYLRDFDAAREMLRDVELRAGPLPGEFADLLVAAVEDPLRKNSIVDTFFDAVEDGDIEALVAFEALLIIGSPRAFDLEIDFNKSFFQFRLPDVVWNNWAVELRRDPRFKNWVRALGYDQYWRKYGWPDRCRPTGLNDFECV